MTTRDEREGPAAGEPDVFLQHLTWGGDLLAAGHTEEALGYLESALSMSPADEKAQNLLGLCCFKLGHLDRAAEIYEHLVRENPVDPTLRVNLGLVYLKANAVQRAVREFETATELAPDHRKAHNYLGLALAQAAEYGRAREHFLLAGSDHMAEKMGRALDGAGFEPVTTPAGGVAALDPSLGTSMTPAPVSADDQGAQDPAASWNGAAMTEAGPGTPAGGEWGEQTPWDPGAERENAWETQSWEEATPGEQGWPHPDESEGWAASGTYEGQDPAGAGWHQDPETGEAIYTPPQDEGWGAHAGHAPYGEAQEDWSQHAGTEHPPYGEAPEGGAWAPEAVQDPYGEAQAGGGWSQDADAELQPGEDGGAWPRDAGAELQPGSEAPAGEVWSPDAGAELQPYGEPQGDEAWTRDPGALSDEEAEQLEGWPQDAGAELQPRDEPVEGDVWPQDAGADLQPESLQQPEAEGDAPVGQEPVGSGDVAAGHDLQPDDEGSPAGGADDDGLPEAASALDDDLASEGSGLSEGGDDPAITPMPGEKVASLKPARLEDSWGAQFGLEGEGTGSSEPAEELVVELNASEVAEQGPDEDAVDLVEVEVDAPVEAPPAQESAASDARSSPSEVGARARPDDRSERAVEETQGARASQAAPSWEERPGARSSGSGWLVDLSRQLELRPGPSTEGFTELGDGVVDLQLREGMRTRTHGYFALEGKVVLTPEPRRIRGRAVEQLFGPTGRELMRVQGSGHLLVRVAGRQLLQLELGEEGLFLRESAVYAFEENVMFENGSLSDPEGNEALKLVHLRGTGRLLVELEGALRTVQIREGAPARVELSRIVGWFGELVPRAVAGVTGMSAHLELSGQGFALIDAAHRGAGP